MVTVVYDGGLGNWLFQYCFGRILAEQLGYKLHAAGIPGIPGTFEKIDGADHSDVAPMVLRAQRPDLSFLADGHDHHLVLDGYFQRYEYYLPHLERIRRWLAVEDRITADVTPQDVVLSVRRGRDYIPRHGLPLSYYDAALSDMRYDRVFICTNEPRDPFVEHLAHKYAAVVRAGSFQGGKIQSDYVAGALDNFVFMQKFNKIVLSNSSFPWWAAFLSDATEIVGPRPASGMWAPSDPISRDMNLEVQQPRYRFIECEQYRSVFWRERMQNAVETLGRARNAAARVFPFLRRKLPDGTAKIVFGDNGR